MGVLSVPKINVWAVGAAPSLAKLGRREAEGGHQGTTNAPVPDNGFIGDEGIAVFGGDAKLSNLKSMLSLLAMDPSLPQVHPRRAMYNRGMTTGRLHLRQTRQRGCWGSTMATPASAPVTYCGKPWAKSQPKALAVLNAPRRVVIAKNCATVSSMMSRADFTASINPADCPASAGAASMSPWK